MQHDDELDPVFAADRNAGVTPPETGAESGNVIGRPVVEGEHAIGFHESTETASLEREAFSGEEALAEGGSYDGLGLPFADDGGSDPHAPPT